MLPTFILTRTFAISALFIGAAPLASAAPIAIKRSPITGACAYYSCMLANVNDDVLSSSVAVPSPEPSAIAPIIEIIEVIPPSPSVVVHEPQLDLVNGGYATPSVLLPSTPTPVTVKVEVESDASPSLDDVLEDLTHLATREDGDIDPRAEPLLVPRAEPLLVPGAESEQT